MQSIKNSVKVNEFFSVCLHLVREAGLIIQSLRKEDNFQQNVQLKGVDDPFTQADLQAQSLIIAGLKQYWPSLQFVGEEDKEPLEQWNYDFRNINPTYLSEQLFENHNEFDCSNAIVWIDPLDGTLSYVNGDLDEVTTLIGVSVDGKPKYGMIGQHFQVLNKNDLFDKIPVSKNDFELGKLLDQQQKDKKYQLNPLIYFGSSQLQFMYMTKASDLEKSQQPPEIIHKPQRDTSKEFVLCTSKNRVSQSQLDNILQLGVTHIKLIGGSGNKILSVLKGLSDIYYYEKIGCKRWDICAGSAILKGFGGDVS